MINKVTDFENIIGYDVEVFKYGWSVSALNFSTGERKYFEHGENSQGDYGYEVKRYFDSHEGLLTVAFNNKGYDNHILRLIMADYDFSEVKQLNDYIINTDNAPWTWVNYPKGFFPYTFLDLMDDLPDRISLKMIEGNLGQEIKESGVSFDLDRPLTKEEWKLNKIYNEYDVDVVKILFDERESYINTKIELGHMGNVSPERALGMTNAQLVATYLVGPYKKAIEYGDDSQYVIPKAIDVKNTTVTDYFLDEDKPNKLDLEIGGIPHVLSGGGLHGGEPTYIGESNDDWQIILADGEQFYPSIMVEYNMLSRSVTDPKLFAQSVADRLVYKARKDDRQNTLKLVNNTTYGASGAKFNALYDKRMANSICYTGQLLLIDLIEKLEVLGDKIQFIQSNTDGIMYRYHRSIEDKMFKINEEWEDRTNIVLDYNYIDKIAQRDVNNYIMRESNGKITVKGSHLKGYHGRTFMDGELHIVAKAIGDYLLTNKSIYDTIVSSSDIMDFQMLARTGRTYDTTYWERNGKDVEVNRVNRVFATKDERYGSLYKIRFDDHETGPKRDKVASVPMNLIVDNENKLSISDIDKQWYVDLATKRVYAFLGEGGMEKMEKKLDEQVKRRTYLRLHEDSNEVKMFNKGDILSGEWAKDDTVLITKREYDKFKEEEEIMEKKTIPTKGKEVKEEVEAVEVEAVEVDEETGEVVEEVVADKPGVEVEVPVFVAKETKEDRLLYYRKRAKLRKIMNESEILKDGYNTHSKYDYMSAEMVKGVFNNALIEAGMEYEVDPLPETFEIERNFTQSMHLNQAQAIIRFIDLDTGYTKEYLTMNVAADSSDKGFNKVTTAIVKYYVINNFLIKGDEVDADGVSVNQGIQNQPKTGYTSPQSRAEAKAKVVGNANEPTKMQVDALSNLCIAIKKEIITDEAEAFLETVKKTLTTKPLSQDEVLKLTLKAENLLTVEREK